MSSSSKKLLLPSRSLLPAGRAAQACADRPRTLAELTAGVGGTQSSYHISDSPPSVGTFVEGEDRIGEPDAVVWPRMALGRVKSFNDEEGWGVLTSDEVPGDIWVHFSQIEADGYRELRTGQQVDVDWEHFPAGQDGYVYRARRVRPL